MDRPTLKKGSANSCMDGGRIHGEGDRRRQKGRGRGKEGFQRKKSSGIVPEKLTFQKQTRGAKKEKRGTFADQRGAAHAKILQGNAGKEITVQGRPPPGDFGQGGGSSRRRKKGGVFPIKGGEKKRKGECPKEGEKRARPIRFAGHGGRNHAHLGGKRPKESMNGGMKNLIEASISRKGGKTMGLAWRGGGLKRRTETGQTISIFSERGEKNGGWKEESAGPAQKREGKKSEVGETTRFDSLLHYEKNCIRQKKKGSGGKGRDAMDREKARMRFSVPAAEKREGRIAEKRVGTSRKSFGRTII